MPDHSARRPVRAAALVAVLVLASACGSALPHDEVVQAARGLPAGGAGSLTSEGGAVQDGAGAADGTAVEPGAAPEAGDPAVGGTDSTGTGGTDSAPGPGAAPGSGGAPAPGGADAPSTGGDAKAPAADAPAGGDRSPIVIGTVGNFSGAPGVTLKPSSVGVKVWAAAVNAKGGIAGHPVEVRIADDQSDPSRYRQILQDMVENEKVVAFVGNAAATTIQAGKSYLEGKKVPVVGSGDGSEAWTTSPMHFSTVSSGNALVFGNFAIAKAQGKKKVAVLSCIEATSCSAWKAASRKYAPRSGLDLAYAADISITQADFTAECLNARNAEADVMAVVGDQNTLYRVARNCAGQGYRPTFISASPSDVDATKSDLPGLIGASHEHPFSGVKGNAASEEYLAAVAKYAPDQPKSQYLAAGWLSGKAFEKAVLAGIGGKKPTSAGVLEGLYTIKKGERLGGLAAGLDFRRGKPNGQAFCWFTNVVKGGKWTTPKGMEATCAAP